MQPQAIAHSFLVLNILQRIPRQRFTTSKQLHEQLEVAGHHLSRRSMQRWLDTIVQHYPIECDTRSKPYGYRWMDGAQGFHLPLLTPAEALLLQLARGEIAPLLPAHVLKKLAPLFASAHQQLHQSTPPPNEKRWLNKVRRIPESLPLQAPHTVPAVFEAISEALYGERKLHLLYCNAVGKQRESTVLPLGIVQQGNRLYLVCRFEGFDNERILAFPRIHQARIGEVFPYPRDFELDRYLAAGHFGIRLGPAVRLSFRIATAERQHLLESPLSADQQHW